MEEHYTSSCASRAEGRRACFSAPSKERRHKRGAAKLPRCRALGIVVCCHRVRQHAHSGRGNRGKDRLFKVVPETMAAGQHSTMRG